MDEHIIKTHVRSIEVLINNCGVYSPDNYDKIYAERWSGLCEVGEKNGFETVLIIQPMVSFGKILTDEEYFDSIVFVNKDYDLPGCFQTYMRNLIWVFF